MTFAVFREPVVSLASSPVGASPSACRQEEETTTTTTSSVQEDRRQKEAGGQRWRLPGLVERLRLSAGRRSVLGDRSNQLAHDARHASMLRADASTSRLPPPCCPDLPATPHDIDGLHDHADTRDPLVCSEYMADIIQHLLHLEMLRRPRPRFLNEQNEIKPNHRFILVNWLVELAYELELETETLHLAVNYVDRFLSLKRVPRRFLQTLGTSALFIAAKYEEIDPCTLADLIQLCDNAVNEEDLIAMEQAILDVLKFNMNAATTLLFVKRLLHVTQNLHDGDKRVEYLTFYLVDLILADYDMLVFRYSDMALAAVMISLYTLRYTCWTSSLKKYSETSAASFMPCIQRVYYIYTSVDKQSASYKLFSQPEKHRVAISIKPRGLPHAYRSPPTPASEMKENVKML